MIVDTKYWAKHKSAASSLAICAVELIMVWGPAAVILLIGQHTSLLKLASIAWLCGGFLSIMFAVAAIIVEPPRKVGLISLIVAVVVFFVCGLTMIV